MPDETTLTFGGRTIGDGHPCFVIAEAGSNHNGRLEQAHRLIEVAARAGADAVKFQVFRASRLYARDAGASGYLKTDRSIYDIIAEMEMPYEWLPELAGACHARGVQFLASAFDEESVDRLAPYSDAVKVASYEMTHLPLVQYVARLGKPVIVSTGTATLDEVREMVEAFRDAGGRQLALMQCTAAYPAPIDALNLRAMATLKTEFGTPVGLSDHSRDPLVAPIAAVGAGANLLEKHFTLSNELPGPDHRFAVEPDELLAMVEKVRAAERALGDGIKTPQGVEQELRAFARRSIFATRDIAAGEPFGPDNVAVLRCGNLPPGLPPRELPRVLASRARRAVSAGVAIGGEDCG